MERSSPVYQAYCRILRDELQMATGCTEPIALAFCAAKARTVLGAVPDRVDIQVSGNIIKNVKSVVVPNTNGLKGIPAAAAAGIVAGDETAGLMVISHISPEQQRMIRAFLDTTPVSVSPMKECDILDIGVSVFSGEQEAYVRLNRTHTHLALISRNGETLWSENPEPDKSGGKTDESLLSIKDIFDYADSLHTGDVKDVLDRQIRCNTAIAREGLGGRWGAGVGRILLATGGNGGRTRARAMAAAGSDARLSGCEMPVVINSGSGNQGLTVSLPVLEYAKELKAGEQDIYRALALANLCAVHLKSAIGKLSAYCGAITAGAAAAAGVAYLKTHDLETIAHTIVNAIAIDSGIVCDGAKPSCAAKISTAIDCGLFGLEMYENGSQFYGGDGILSKGIENTIRNIGELGREGMRETDAKILEIMTRDNRSRP